MNPFTKKAFVLSLFVFALFALADTADTADTAGTTSEKESSSASTSAVASDQSISVANTGQGSVSIVNSGNSNGGNANESTDETQWDIYFAVLFGILALIIFFNKNLTAQQYGIYKIFLALASAGVAGSMAGTIDVEYVIENTLVIRACSGFAVFIIIYFFTPKLPSSDHEISDNATNQS